MINKISCVVNDIALENMDLEREHGLSFWIETSAGIAMFDTGQSSRVLTHNLKILDLDVQNISALAISHAHYDHTGGLNAVFAETSDLPFFAHPDIFRARFSLKNGEYKSIGMSLSQQALSEHVIMKLSAEPQEILPGLWTTGEIVERPEVEGRSAHHFIKDGRNYKPDPYKDDMSLVLEIQDKLILICGCCHAGLLNTLMHVRRVFQKPVYAVVGGTHLLSADGSSMRHIIEILSEQFPQLLYFVNHCTGGDAANMLAQSFGERVAVCPAGTVIDFDEHFSA